MKNIPDNEKEKAAKIKHIKIDTEQKQAYKQLEEIIRQIKSDAEIIRQNIFN